MPQGSSSSPVLLPFLIPARMQIHGQHSCFSKLRICTERVCSMRDNHSKRVYAMRSLFCLLLAATPLCSLQPIETAVQEQHAGNSAQAPQEKQRLLNSALTAYLEYAQDCPSGALLYNIGTVYFSLGEFGPAIAYYRQALSLLPRNKTIQQSLQLAEAQAGIEPLQQRHPIADFIGLQWCSPAERSAIALGAAAFSLVFFSLNLWLPLAGFRFIWRTAALCTALLLSALTWHMLFVPQQATVVRAALLKPFASASSAEPGLPTIRAGETVEVLGSDLPSGSARVKTASEAIGYLPRSDLCFASPLK